MYNSIAWVLTGQSKYASNSANFIKTWFIDPATAMNPNLNYAQVSYPSETLLLVVNLNTDEPRTQRPNGSADWSLVSTSDQRLCRHEPTFLHRDLRGICKILSGILILRKGASPEWSNDIDSQMRSWATKYIEWLTTAELAKKESQAAK